MKWTKKRIVFIVGQILCYVIIPIILICINYSSHNQAPMFKGLISMIILLVFLTWFLKKVVLNARIEEMSKQAVIIRAKVVDMTDPQMLELNRKALNRLRLWDLILRLIMPALVFIGMLVILIGVESTIIKLSGVLVFIVIPLLVGVGFNILEIVTSKLKNEE